MVEGAPGKSPTQSGAAAGLILPVSPACTVRMAEERSRFVLQGPDAARTMAGRAFGVALPVNPLEVMTGADGSRAALWLGPDEWLLLAPATEAAMLGEELGKALAGSPHALVDVTHRQMGLCLEGPLAARLIAAGCPLDLRLKSFPAGRATRSVFHKTEILLWRQTEHRFHIEIWRSFLPYLVGHLHHAMTGLD
ncbi:MAG TPA: sarcosine oxidase subunit gamma family protein [Beijerinckiaceae bacterium]|nr:sarcosine oxidase subunit gamma family protein [Beijerinckiaceae bacterium]